MSLLTNYFSNYNSICEERNQVSHKISKLYDELNSLKYESEALDYKLTSLKTLDNVPSIFENDGFKHIVDFIMSGFENKSKTFTIYRNVMSPHVLTKKIIPFHRYQNIKDVRLLEDYAQWFVNKYCDFGDSNNQNVKIDKHHKKYQEIKGTCQHNFEVNVSSVPGENTYKENYGIVMIISIL
jgi:hypothetical protein